MSMHLCCWGSNGPWLTMWWGLELFFAPLQCNLQHSGGFSWMVNLIIVTPLFNTTPQRAWAYKTCREHILKQSLSFSPISCVVYTALWLEPYNAFIIGVCLSKIDMCIFEVRDTNQRVGNSILRSRSVVRCAIIIVTFLPGAGWRSAKMWIKNRKLLIVFVSENIHLRLLEKEMNNLYVIV